MTSLFPAMYLMLLVIPAVLADDWTEIPGGLVNIGSSVNYLWGVNSNDDIYICTRPCTGSWTHIAGKLVQVDPSDNELWGTNSAQNIFKRSVDASGSWIGVSGKLKQVSGSGNGYVWGLKSTGHIYKCKKPCNGG